MGFKFQHRLNYGSGLGLNLSTSGASPSFRSRMGSISAKGFSIRTGVPGLSFRRSWGKGPGGAIIGLTTTIVTLGIVIGLKVFLVLCGLAIAAAWLITALVFNLSVWIVLTTRDFVKYTLDKRREKPAQ
jgi:hypothetical protein